MEPACLVCRSSEYLTQGCGGLSLSPLDTDPAASRPPGERECGGLPLTLLVTDPAASCPTGEREQVHRFSVRRRRGRTSRSEVHAILSDQAPVRQGLRHLLADSARRRSPSYIPTTSRYPLRPCSTTRLPTSRGSSIVLCPKCSSSGVLSILHSRPQTFLDKHNRVVIFP